MYTDDPDYPGWGEKARHRMACVLSMLLDAQRGNVEQCICDFKWRFETRIPDERSA